ncbi:MAG: M1 family peptidase, partial [Bacteroidetes bacterium]|nr:M1 family peptidase [Bacteroidota bacterium]MBU1760858.1 M1 family peptidase [Bacteroidota bacterium]
IADMWIHESFTTYSENLFVEYFYGKEAGADYVIGQRKNIKLDGPIIGVYGVNKEGSGDMYDKGANLLHTIRQIINNDEKWRSILTGLNTTFGKKTTTTTQVVNYFNQQSGTNFTPVFDQYLRYKNIPVLEFKQEGNQILMRWKTDVKDFAMPVRLAGQNNFVYPTNNWKVLKTATSLNDIKVDRNFYVDAKIIN